MDKLSYWQWTGNQPPCSKVSVLLLMDKLSYTPDEGGEIWQFRSQSYFLWTSSLTRINRQFSDFARKSQSYFLWTSSLTIFSLPSCNIIGTVSVLLLMDKLSYTFCICRSRMDGTISEKDIFFTQLEFATGLKPDQSRSTIKINITDKFIDELTTRYAELLKKGQRPFLPEFLHSKYESQITQDNEDVLVQLARGLDNPKELINFMFQIVDFNKNYTGETVPFRYFDLDTL